MFELTNKLHCNCDPDGPIDWLLCRDDNHSDTLWAFEFYKDADSFMHHFTNPAIEDGHDEVLELLAEVPTNTTIILKEKFLCRSICFSIVLENREKYL